MEYLKKALTTFYLRKSLNVFWGDNGEWSEFFDKNSNNDRIIFVGDFSNFDKLSFVKEMETYDIFFVDYRKDIFSDNDILNDIDVTYNLKVKRRDSDRDKEYINTVFLGYGMGCNIICSYIRKYEPRYDNVILVCPKISILTEYCNKYTGFQIFKNISKKLNDFYIFNDIIYIKNVKIFIEIKNTYMMLELSKNKVKDNIRYIDVFGDDIENIFHTDILKYIKMLYPVNDDYLD